MRKLSKYEKETIINWNEAENLASIYTFKDRKSTRLNSSHSGQSRMPSSA